MRPLGYRGVAPDVNTLCFKGPFGGIGGVAPDVNTLCFKGPFGGIGGVAPDVNTLCFKGRGIRRIVSRSSRKAISDLAWRWPGRAWCLLRA